MLVRSLPWIYEWDISFSDSRYWLRDCRQWCWVTSSLRNMKWAGMSGHTTQWYHWMVWLWSDWLAFGWSVERLSLIWIHLICISCRSVGGVSNVLGLYISPVPLRVSHTSHFPSHHLLILHPPLYNSIWLLSLKLFYRREVKTCYLRGRFFGTCLLPAFAPPLLHLSLSVVPCCP